MSENCISFYCDLSSDVELCENDFNEIVDNFCRKINHEDQPSIILENSTLTIILNFFEAGFSAVEILNDEIVQYCSRPPVIEVYVDGVDKISFIAFLKGQLREFDTRKSAESAIEQSLKIAKIDKNSLPYVVGETTLIQISFTSSKQLSHVHSVLNQVISSELRDVKNLSQVMKAALVKDFYFFQEFGENSSVEVAWKGELDRVLPHLTFASLVNDHLLLGFDLFNVNLYGAEYVSKRAKLPLVKEKLIYAARDSLFEHIETFATQLTELKGMTRMELRFRQHALEEDREIWVIGGNSYDVEVQYIRQQKISNDDEWII